MKNKNHHLKVFTICIFIFLLYFTNGYSQVYHFEIKYSKKDIDKQRELFKKAKVKFVIIGEGEAEKISFDKEGRILTWQNDPTDVEDSEPFASKYLYNTIGQLVKVNFDSGDGYEYNLTYDDSGNVKKLTDKYRPTEIYQYDGNNNMSQIDFESATRSVCPSIVLKYDDNNRLIERIEPCCDGSLKNSNYAYDEIGNVYEIITNYSDCNQTNKSFTKAKYTYNLRNLPISIEYNSSEGSTRIERITYEYYK